MIDELRLERNSMSKLFMFKLFLNLKLPIKVILHLCFILLTSCPLMIKSNVMTCIRSTYDYSLLWSSSSQQRNVCELYLKVLNALVDWDIWKTQEFQFFCEIHRCFQFGKEQPIYCHLSSLNLSQKNDHFSQNF